MGGTLRAMARRRAAHALAVFALLVPACVFDTSGVTWPGDDGGNGPPDARADASAADARPIPDAPGNPDAPRPADAALADAKLPDPITEDVAHVPVGGEFATLADLTLGNDTIDTTNLEINGAAPPGAVFDVWTQDVAGPDLAILHVHTMTIEAGSTVMVTGDRPFVILASNAVVITD